MATKAAPGKGTKPSEFKQTLYCKNLPDKLPKDALKRNLYMLFATYGVILEIVAQKGAKMRGQAHIVFRDIESATQAMRALNGFNFFDKAMKIEYAKSKSDTIAKLQGTYHSTIHIDDDKSGEPTATGEPGSVFGSGAAPLKAKALNAPDESGKGVKRGRDESDAEDDDSDAMELSDSD